MDAAGGAGLIRYPYWNIQQPLDVNNDGRITAFDAITIINDLNTRGARSLATGGVTGASGGESSNEPLPFVDVNNDNRLTSMDAVTVINRLNSSAGAGDPMIKITVQIVAAGTNNDITSISKGGFYDVRILAEDLGVLSYMGKTRTSADGVITSFFDVLYDTTKTDFEVNDVQNINIVGGTNNGTFTLTVNDHGTLKTTAPITYAANRDTANANIQTALDNALGEGRVEVSRGTGTTNFKLRFINQLSNLDVPDVVATKDASLGGSSSIVVTELVKGVTNAAVRAVPGQQTPPATVLAAVADAFRVRTFYDTDSTPLNDDPPFYQDQRVGFVETFGINDIGGSNFQDPFPGTAPTEIVRLRMTANDAGIVPIQVSFANVNDSLESGVVGFNVPVTVDLITVVNDSITIVEPLSAGDDTATITEGSTTPLTLSVLANDVNNSPTPNTTKTIQSVNTTGTLGNVQILPGSTQIRYTPPGGDVNGTDTFTYTVVDQGGNTDTATVTINITPVNDAPTVTVPTVAQTFAEDTTRVFTSGGGNGISVNDVDNPTLPMTLTLSVGAGNGTLTLAGTNGLTGLVGNGTSTITVNGTKDDLNLALDGLSYTPAANATGNFTLNITINDNGQTPAPALQGTGSVSLVVTPVNDKPVVELGGVTIAPTVVEGDPLVLNSANGTLIQVSDVDAGSSPVLVTLHVTAGNTVHVNTTPGVTIGTNDTNNVTLTGTIANINTALNGITYTAAIGFAPTAESLQITVNDQGNTGTGGAQSDTKSVAITVDPATRPRARQDNATVAEDSSTGTSVTVLANDIVNVGATGILLSFQATSAHNGTITRVGDNLVYVPAPNYFGPDSFTYTMNDNSGLGADSTGTVNVTVTEVNDAPTAVDDAISSIAEDSGVRTITAATLTGNDSAGPLETAQTLTITAAGSAVGGTVAVVGGNVQFTPTADYNGPASFTYTVTDNGTTNGVADPKSATATVTFTITEVNDAPTASNQTLANVAEDTATVTVPFATLLTGATAGPANENTQTLTISAVSAPVGGTVAIQGTDVVFTPTANYNGPASFSFTVTDNGTTNGAADPKSVTRTASFTITPVNDAANAVDDAVTISEGQVIDIAVTANDRDVDVNPPTGTAGQLQAGTTVAIVTAPLATQGTAVVNANGTIKFTPAAGFFGVATFTYQLDDHNSPNNLSNIATVSVTVTELNDPPVANNDTATTAEDTSVAIDALANDTDPDTAKANWSVTIVTPPQHGTAVFNTTTRKIDYTPAADYNGPDSFTYKVNDQSTIAPLALDSNTATVSITVTEVNDAPVGGTDPSPTTRYTVIKDRDRTFTAASLLANDTAGPANESTQTLTLTAVSATSTAGGTVTLVGGVVTYTPLAGYIGQDSFTYTITDNGLTNGVADPKSTVVTVRIDVVDFIPTDVNGYVYRDVNANGTYDVGVDFPLSGVQVTLTGASDINGAIAPITVETNYLGFYQFTGVEPGDYHIKETQPVGLSDRLETLGLAATLFANDDILLDLPLLGLAGGVSRNDFGEGAINAAALVNSSGLQAELDASSSKDGFVMATTLTGNSIWSWSLKNWGGMTDVSVVLDADLKAATLTATDGLGVAHTVRIFVNPYDTRNPNRPTTTPATNVSNLARFRVLGYDANGNYLLRIDGKASDFFGVGTPLAVAAPQPLSAGEYVGGVDAAMAEGNWA